MGKRIKNGKEGSSKVKGNIIGIDIGGTTCSVVLGSASPEIKDYQGLILDRIKFDTMVETGYTTILEKIFNNIDTLLVRNQVPLQNIRGIGISCGGPLDHKRGVIMNPPNLFGWDHVPLVELITKKYGLQTYLQNDANAGILAEWKYGIARNCNNAVFLTFGTGMGMGMILNGVLYHGTNDMAGEIGHIRMESSGPTGFGKIGSFEGFCSGNGIAQLGKIKALESFQKGIQPSFCKTVEELDSITAKGIALLAEDHEDAREVLNISAAYLGKGLSILIDILNPEIIVVGSIFSRNYEKFWPITRKIVESESLERSLSCCKVVPSYLGDSIGDIAALSVALYGLEQQ